MRSIIGLFLFFSLSVHAQQKLFGVAQKGGSLGGGTIFSINSDGSQFSTEINFGGHLKWPQPVLVQDANGYIYGIAGGGNWGQGSLYKIRRDGTGFTNLFSFKESFNDGDGVSDGGLTLSANGVLYGTTVQGGINGSGVLYKINTDGAGYVKLFEFPNGLVTPPTRATLILGSDGSLYGTNYAGMSGPGGYGAVYKINTDGSGYAKLVDFSSKMESNPNGLIQAWDGQLYGTTFWGAQYGAIFKVNTDGTEYAKIHDFQTGELPNIGLIQGSDGSLYGTTQGGGLNDVGMIYKINTNGTGFTKLFDFGGLNGASPSQGMRQGPAGVLYGSTDMGGTNNQGILYKINPDGSGFLKLNDLEATPSSGPPMVKLLEDTNGNFFGTSLQGGANQFGFLFQIKGDGSNFADFYDFGEADVTRYTPYLGLTMGSDSSLYGVAWSATNSTGLLFKVTPAEHGLIDFYTLGDPVRGSNVSGVAEGSDGYLYGGIHFGGSYEGFLYKIKKDGTGYTRLHDFGSNARPDSNPIQGSDGFLYGTSPVGGANGYGIIYKVKTDGTNYTTLFDFNYSNGNYPSASLILGERGGLYGTTAEGGAHAGGVIYKLNADGTGFLKLYDFNPSDGSNPYGDLVQVADGILYGTCAFGGNNNQGTIFKINPDGSGFSKLYDFDDVTGARPRTGLIQGEDGYLYGTTYMGGSFNMGVLYKISPDGTGFIKLKDLDPVSGSNPMGGLLAIKLFQAITFGPLTPKTLGDAPFNLIATSNSGLTISYLSSNLNIAQISGNTVTLVGTGAVNFMAVQLGNGNYYPASTVGQTICVNPVKPIITTSGMNSLRSSNPVGNQWFLDGTPLNGATDQTLTLALSGTYTVQTTIDNCSSVFSDEQTAVVTGDIKTLGTETKISVYPNPTSEGIDIRLENFQPGSVVNITVFDVLGRKLSSLDGGNNKVIRLDIAQYVSGTYILKACQSGNSYQARFVKQ